MNRNPKILPKSGYLNPGEDIGTGLLSSIVRWTNAWLPIDCGLLTWNGPPQTSGDTERGTFSTQPTSGAAVAEGVEDYLLRQER